MLESDISELVPPSHHPEYIPKLLQICRHHKARVLLSLHDLDIACLASHRQAFLDIGTFPLFPDEQFARICLDKYETWRFCQSNGFAVPLTFCGVDEAKNALRDGAIKFPLILKPRIGFGSHGLHQVDSLEDLDFTFRHIQSLIRRTPIVYSPNYDESAAVLIQQKMTGQESAAYVVTDLQGRYISTYAVRKNQMWGGETVDALVENDPALERFGAKLAQITHHPVNLSVDVIVQNGVPTVLEMNPRFSGVYPFLHLAGLDLPRAIVAWIEDRPVAPSAFRIRHGLRGYKDLFVKEMQYK
jgi:carbamoyl-phosphate synthase large subunit